MGKNKQAKDKWICDWDCEEAGDSNSEFDESKKTKTKRRWTACIRVTSTENL